eukprot:gnl/Hemi2/184_TR56_c0_g1_i1.p1 gnl/Hemi2/184_TR56_c0_g1~~gnl/Hemi2/184_TR56_c0_g1_i1.p1  ORF type:complete len:113 (+),score=29.99 gnl/Hemi2/184_TR56_c0_g1_i1:53-391(+)
MSHGLPVPSNVNYNDDLAKCLDEMKVRREDLNRQISKDEEEKNKLQNEIRILNDRLQRVSDGLAAKYSSRDEYDKTIQETEDAFKKILASQHTLLTFIKRASQQQHMQTKPR